MAGARPGVHVVQLKPVRVPESLTRGNKFVRWDDDSTTGTPVTLKVDPKGYLLYWQDQVKPTTTSSASSSKMEMDSLDISLIRDTRTGKYARVPKEPKLRDSVTMGAQDVPLEDKIFTICYGTDMVNLNYVSFAANCRQVAMDWTDEIFTYATNLLAQNASPISYLDKCYTKLTLIVNNEGKIPVRNILKMFASHKDDRRRVEKALEAARLPHGKNDMLNPANFSFEDFLSFYRHLCGRQEVERIFHDLGAKKKPYLTAEQFKDFLNSTQRDSRLNEILFPYCDVQKAQSLINQFEPNSHLANKDSGIPAGHLSQEGFLRYLLSDENALIPSDILDLSEDMDQPLSHYFINSSHNTYLTGHQFTGKSSVEIYRQALLSGCRCVELDCWDGKGADEEPMITHGYTMCTDIIFKDVIEAIAESAFKVSEFPVILSFENHCSPKQQAKMAQHCRNILGDALLIEPVDGFPLRADEALPSPSLLRGRIIIKNKKRHCPKKRISKNEQGKITSDVDDESASPDKDNTEDVKGGATEEPQSRGGATDNKGPVSEEAETGLTESKGEVREVGEMEEEEGEERTQYRGDSSSESDMESEEEEEETEEDDKLKQTEKQEKGTAGQEAAAGMEMSALVNYIQPARFHSFEYADKRGRAYECNSFVETQATGLLKEFPVEFVNFNKRQISRIYPKGTRVDSSNYMPQIFWNAGCQLVALNYQTLDLSMQLNLGFFEYNGLSGYRLKPDFMRRKDKQFDPFAESTVDGIVAGTVEITVISGQFLTDKKVGTYVEVDMYGLPADTVRKRFKTKVVQANGICPHWGEEPFVFTKVILPHLATLRFAAHDENGRLLGHRILPVAGIRPGYRHVCLRNELNQQQALATLFLKITAKDYVPDALQEFAAAIENPIAYQSKLEKHAQQLAVLEEEDDEDDEELVLQEDVEQEGDGAVSLARNCSVRSRGSASGSDTPVMSRVSSVSRRPLTKQESTVSGVSQMSISSGPASAATSSVGSPVFCPSSPLSPSTPTHDAPKSWRNRFFSDAGTCLEVKRPSFGPQRQHSVHNPVNISEQNTYRERFLSQCMVNSWNVPDNSMLVDKLEKIPAVQDRSLKHSFKSWTSLRVPRRKSEHGVERKALTDPDIVENVTLDSLKDSKQFSKLLNKLDKELDSLCKKHEKIRLNQQELHELQKEKLVVAQIRTKSSFEKTHRKSIKKTNKSSEVEEVTKNAEQELSVLLTEHETKHRELEKGQVDKMVRLFKEHYKLELDLQHKYHPLLYDTLDAITASSHISQLKHLDQVHDREVVELKKKLDSQNRDEMKMLAKKHRDKNELSRIKREAMQKHITMAVHERQKLQDILRKRKAEVEDNFEKLKSKVTEERMKRMAELTESYSQRLSQIESECAKFAAARKTDERQTQAQVANGEDCPGDESTQGSVAMVTSVGEHINPCTEDTPLTE